MTFDDLKSFFIVMKEQRNEEMSQLSFELIKMQSGQLDIGREDLVNFSKKIAQISEIYVNDFYSLTHLDPNERITKEMFIKAFPAFQNLRFIEFIKKTLIEGYKNENLNFEDNQMSLELLKRLKEIQMK